MPGRRHKGPTRRVRTVNQSRFPQLAFDQCVLCANSSDLRASHIIPGFVVDWLRNTSATGHFRLSENPNLRIQDGLKPRMLCSNCEQMFAPWEKTFAEKCFVPINRGSVPSIRYGPWMLKFSTSVSWRVLRLFKAAGLLSEAPGDVQVQVDLALRAWKLFLFGERPHPGRHEQHMILADVIESSSDPDLPTNMNRYLTRGHCQSNWTKPQELAIEDSQAASWRHSVRAAARCCLKMSRRLRWRSWLKCNSVLEDPQYHGAPDSLRVSPLGRAGCLC